MFLSMGVHRKIDERKLPISLNKTSFFSLLLLKLIGWCKNDFDKVKACRGVWGLLLNTYPQSLQPLWSFGRNCLHHEVRKNWHDRWGTHSKTAAQLDMSVGQWCFFFCSFKNRFFHLFFPFSTNKRFTQFFPSFSNY